MTITAKIIADSISPDGIRLTTLQLRYPKFIHGEFMTHRVFSRNASSSRAIPVERLIQDVIDDPAMPIYWGKNQPGMQAAEELSEGATELTKEDWLYARDACIKHARVMINRKVHKQIVNRIIEPWCHINVVVTSTDWANFFALRRHEAAQPEMRMLADVIYIAMDDSKPELLQPGQWHCPYVSYDDFYHTAHDQPDNEITAIKISVARCARVSYLTHEGKAPNIEDDLKLYDRLVGSEPLHASPAEHQATPDHIEYIDADLVNHWSYPMRHGNFRGWCQYRKMLPNENVMD